jgi:hypothetical protein
LIDILKEITASIIGLYGLISLKRVSIFTGLHVATSQKSAILIPLKTKISPKIVVFFQARTGILNVI